MICYETRSGEKKKKQQGAALYGRMDGWEPGADFILFYFFLKQMPGPAYARGLGGVQFRESIKVLCSLAPLLPPAPAA